MRQGFKNILKQFNISVIFIKVSCLVILLLIVVLAGAQSLTEGRPHIYVYIYNWETGETLIKSQIDRGEIITLNYIHSADRTPVEAVFEVDEKGLKIIEESYSWYGAGLEAGSGRNFTFEDDRVTVSGYDDKYMEELPIRVARTVPQELLIGKDLIVLNDLAPGGTLLIIKIEE